MKSYQDLEAYLNTRVQFGIKFGLDNINTILDRSGRPQDCMKFIHIAGTNGKGSCAAMISAVLTKAGINTGLYTSPHLITPRERIRVNERDISEGEFVEIAAELSEKAPSEITYFEFLTAAALQYFKKQKVEIAVMETGMGGRLDATNVCSSDIAVITDISLDHMQYLGNTVEEIENEKLAIIKQGSIVIKAKDLVQGRDYLQKSWGLEYQYIKAGAYDNIRLPLLGLFQGRNCAVVIKVIETLIGKGYNISSKDIYEGIKNVRWPARFQILAKEPLIILDGGHNPGAVKTVRDSIKGYFPDKEIILIFGVLKDKDYKEMAGTLFPIAKEVITVTPYSNRALPGNELCFNERIKFIPEVKNAIHYAVRRAGKDNLILITGSLFLAGEVLKDWDTKVTSGNRTVCVG